MGSDAAAGLFLGMMVLGAMKANRERAAARDEATRRTSSRGFAGYRDVHEWREATFGDVRRTWDPSRRDGFAGYASVSDWRRATFDHR